MTLFLWDLTNYERIKQENKPNNTEPVYQEYIYHIFF